MVRIRGLIKGKPNDKHGFGEVVYAMIVTNAAVVSDPSRGGDIFKRRIAGRVASREETSLSRLQL
jgi:hypothetical protein